jgi:hypothetical protein
MKLNGTRQIGQLKKLNMKKILQRSITYMLMETKLVLGVLNYE